MPSPRQAASRRHLRPGRLIALVTWVLCSLCPALAADTTLIFPKLSLKEGDLTGFAFMNPGAEEALVTLTAYGADGLPLAGDGFQNPQEIRVPANQQLAVLNTDLFKNLSDPDRVAWLEAVTPVEDLTGFFAFLDGSVTLLDGADSPESSLELLFNLVKVGSGHVTELNLVNPSLSPATVQLELIGEKRVKKQIELPTKGAARLDVAPFFELAELAGPAFVKVTSDIAVAGFEIVRSSRGDALGLNARRSAEALSELYFPQMAVGGLWNTELGLVNSGSTALIATVTAYRADGELYKTGQVLQNPINVSLNPESSARLDVASAFGFTDSSGLDGWLKVVATSPSLSGYLAYGIESTGLVAAVPPAVEAKTRGLFSHLASDGGYYTGIAALNTGSVVANLRVLIAKPDGQILGTYDTAIPPRHRLARLVQELIPASDRQSGGLIWVKSDFPLRLSSLFGTLSVLANIPPQSAPTTYEPDAQSAKVRLTPPLAVIAPGKTTKFSLLAPPGTVTWRVNGVAGGNDTSGRITSQGQYTAPAQSPDSLGVAVTAESGAASAGASVDVIELAELIGGLGVVQAVVYLSSLQKLYEVELRTAATAGANPLDSPATAQNSSVYEVSPLIGKTLLTSFEGEEISAAIPYTSSTGQEFMLLAGKQTGRVIRLDPSTKASVVIASGLDRPSALVLDRVDGELLIAEATQVTSLPNATLESGLAALSRPLSIQTPRQIFSLEEVDSMATDLCTGDIYFIAGTRLFRYQRRQNRLLTLSDDLRDPGPVLALRRVGVPCPDATHILIVERGLDRITRLIPGSLQRDSWISSKDISSLAFLPDSNPFNRRTGVLLATPGRIQLAKVNDLYDQQPFQRSGEITGSAQATATILYPPENATFSLNGRAFLAIPIVSSFSLDFVYDVANRRQIHATGQLLIPRTQTPPCLSAAPAATRITYGVGHIRGRITAEAVVPTELARQGRIPHPCNPELMIQVRPDILAQASNWLGQIPLPTRIESMDGTGLFDFDLGIDGMSGRGRFGSPQAPHRPFVFGRFQIFPAGEYEIGFTVHLEGRRITQTRRVFRVIP